MYKIDLHIHSVLSPCGTLEMSPVAILQKASESGLDLIGITDHNTTRQSKIVRDLSIPYQVAVLCGAEVTSSEEVHCLALFETDDLLDQFQRYLDEKLPALPNDPARFGFQVVVNEAEEILYEEKRMLSGALDAGIDEIIDQINQLGGIAIPSHVNRMRNGMMGQLGFIPADIQCDALEIFNRTDPDQFRVDYPQLGQFSLIISSDAHTPEQIGRAWTEIELDEMSFQGLKRALRDPGRIQMKRV